MAVNGLVLSLSGIVTFSDGSSTPFEATYDSMGGVSSVSHASNVEAADQLHPGSSLLGVNLGSIVLRMIYNGIAPVLSFGNDPAVQKTITDMVFRVSGLVTDTDGTIGPVSVTYQNGILSNNLNANPFLFGSPPYAEYIPAGVNPTWENFIFDTCAEALDGITHL